MGAWGFPAPCSPNLHTSGGIPPPTARSSAERISRAPFDPPPGRGRGHSHALRIPLGTRAGGFLRRAARSIGPPPRRERGHSRALPDTSVRIPTTTAPPSTASAPAAPRSSRRLDASVRIRMPYAYPLGDERGHFCGDRAPAPIVPDRASLEELTDGEPWRAWAGEQGATRGARGDSFTKLEVAYWGIAHRTLG